jgi:hypothetical protein
MESAKWQQRRWMVVWRRGSAPPGRDEAPSLSSRARDLRAADLTIKILSTPIGGAEECLK